MKILLIDNYDSFVYNIVGLLQRCRCEYPDLEWDVVMNDEVSPCDAERYDAIILSPGPGLPSESGRLSEMIRHCAATHPMLGVCLGCQAIAEVFGSSLCLGTRSYLHQKSVDRYAGNCPWIRYGKCLFAR